ncbi:MAG: phospholipase D-like domain-containing protein [Gemmatimonadaceae bacterium]
MEWLVDNARAYEAALSAIGEARRSIWITQLAFDADCRVYVSGENRAGHDTHVVLLDALLEAARSRGVAIRILLNASRLLDTASALRTAIARAGPLDIVVHGVDNFPQLLHAKMLLVDDNDAILLGSPFVNGYWDDTDHRPVEARRPNRELGGRPVHDVSLRLSGAPARQLGVLFAELWNGATDGTGPPERVRVRGGCIREDHAVRPSIQVVRTVPKRMLPQRPAGCTEIVEAIEAGLRRARSLVYVEHQYLSARRIVSALATALEREPALEVIVVMNQNPDVTAYRGWQNARLRESGFLTHPRVGLFALWSATPPRGDRPRLLNQLFVHSKVLMVDDQWATVGSANLDGVSLHSYGADFTGRLGRRIFRDVRNVDVNVVVRSDGSRRGAVSELRVRLWSEHLGVPAGSLHVPRDEGWLPLWRSRAASNVAALVAGSPVVRESPGAASFVLPYSNRPTPARQLRELGVDLSPSLRLCFNPNWLEVHASPNWVRNMFA